MKETALSLIQMFFNGVFLFQQLIGVTGCVKLLFFADLKMRFFPEKITTIHCLSVEHPAPSLPSKTKKILTKNNFSIVLF